MNLSDFAELPLEKVAASFKVASPSQQGSLFAQLYEQVQLVSAANESAQIELEERVKQLEAAQS